MVFLSLLFLFVLCGCKDKEQNEVIFDKDAQVMEIKSEDAKINDGSLELFEEDANAVDTKEQKSFIANFSKGDRIYYGFDQFSLSENDKNYLNDMAQYLEQNPDLSLEIQGNCDSVGSKDYNIALGEKRANAVFEYLTSLGIAAHRIVSISFGSRILVPGDTDEAREKNRVAIMVVK